MLSGKFSFKTYSFEIFGWFIKKHFFRSLKYSKNDLDSSFLLIWFRTHPKICTFCHNCLVLVFQFFVGKGVRLTYKRERSRSPAWLPSRVSVSHFHLAAGPLNQAALYYPGAQLTQGSNLTLCSQTTPPPQFPSLGLVPALNATFLSFVPNFYESPRLAGHSLALSLTLHLSFQFPLHPYPCRFKPGWL